MNSVRVLLDKLSSRPHLALVTLLGILGSVYAGLSAGQGDYLKVYAIVFAALAGFAILKLGSRYWMLMPLAFPLDIPAIPIGGRAFEPAELAVMGCAAMCLARRALKLQRVQIFRMPHLPIILYTAWSVLIFAHNPVGLSSMGAGAGGARFYIKILLGFTAFIIMANQTFTEKDCKWIFRFMVLGAVVNLAQTLFTTFVLGQSYYLPGLGDPTEEDSYGWHQELAALPSLALLMLFSRYKAGEIFSLQNLWKLVLLMICIPVILLSGKRAAFGAVLLYLIFSAVVRKEYHFLLLWIGGAVTAGFLVVAGQGTIFNLPLTAQRALSWLPGKWDPEFESLKGGSDDFRTMLRLLATEKVQRSPWIGTGYEVDLNLVARMMMTPPDTVEGQVLGHALSSNWHNTWIGYAADFGIPASVIAAIIYATIITLGWQTQRRLPSGTMHHAMVLFILFSTLRDLMFSHTSGHSALTAFSRWWTFGILVSIAIQSKQAKPKQPAHQPQPRFIPTVPKRREEMAEQLRFRPVRVRLPDAS